MAVGYSICCKDCSRAWTRITISGMRIWIIATGNAHKLEEIQARLGADTDLILGLKSFVGVPDVIEDALTFEGNAEKKALGLAEWIEGTGRAQAVKVLQEKAPETELTSAEIWSLADDSGLEVDALNGEPGVKSARYAAGPETEGNAPDSENNAKLLKALENVDDRSGRFRCVLAAARISDVFSQEHTNGVGAIGDAKREVRFYRGACEGSLLREAAGSQGFGYDPLFVPVGYNQSFGELGEEVKGKLSHRAKALEAMLQDFPKHT